MTTFKICQTIPAIEVTEGAGVTVYRTIGTPALRQLDPFLLLDQFSSDDPENYIAGFPSHPHRGFNTFSYMINGGMTHKDSMGNTGKLGPGGAQWMKAASGVIHSEMPTQDNGLMRGFQLWINLPAAHKMDAPEYQEYAADAFPVVTSGGATVKVVVGDYGDVTSPIRDGITDVRYLDVQLEPGAPFRCPLSEGHNGFLYGFAGDGAMDSCQVDEKVLVTLTGDAWEFVAGERGARFLLVSGKPLNEPVVQHGPFVMNTREEIDEALRDYQSNQLVRGKAWINNTGSHSQTGA